MNEVTAEELANETEIVIDRATRGESMVVMDRGQPIALLLPPPSERAVADSSDFLG
ncbi:hypothetical protein [Nocardioides sp. NPDC006273]|uniref:type II toxin-antitoxin system Phd/YefM family antitoxin n=1 Tax=Nocardioides sp. NPDC006273 TaxID=3155598 RepID=UPI0033A6F3CB